MTLANDYQENERKFARKTFQTMQLKSSFFLAATLFAAATSAAPDFCTPGYQPIQDSNLKLDLAKLSR